MTIGPNDQTLVPTQNHRCSHCGYCPHCGQSQPTIPEFPVYPITPYPIYPYYPPYQPNVYVTTTQMTKVADTTPGQQLYNTLTGKPT